MLIKYKATSSAESDNGYKALGYSTLKTLRRTDIKRVKLPEDVDVEEALKIYRDDPDVEYAEPNYRYHVTFLPNDTDFVKLWGLNNTGQTVNNEIGTVDADIDAPEAWDVTTGSSDVIVAVIDSGVDYNHPDLAANIWINENEIPDNGIDDDLNGKIDDTQGWDFVDSDNDPMDYTDHGTPVAGIVAAVGNNSNGVTGVSWSAKIMNLRGLDAEGYGYTDDLIEAISYAIEKGADIINLSWGGENYSQALKDTIESSQALVVCAAGNESDDTDSLPHYPSGYDCDNIISVAATNQYDNLAYFSNYGTSSVDVGAPGINIYGASSVSISGSEYRFVNGTSTAVPYVSGLGALIKAEAPLLDYSGIRDVILDSVDVKTLLNGRVATGGRINAYNALNLVQNIICIDVVLELSAYSAMEGDGVLSAMGTVNIPSPREFDTLFYLTSSDTSEVTVPASITIPAGQTSAVFDLTIIDDIYVDGVKSVDITCFLSYCARDTEAVQVDDNEDASITVEVPEYASEGDGDFSNTGTVELSAPLENDLVVHLISSDPSEVEVPVEVTVPAGIDSVSFNLTVIDDIAIDWDQIVTITAEAEGWNSGSDTISVLDNDNLSWVEGISSLNLSSILRDDFRDRIYLGDAGNRQLIVIDSRSLEVIVCIPLQNTFEDMAISKDNRRMIIAGGNIILVDLETFQTKYFTVDVDVGSAVFDHNGDLILASLSSDYLYYYDPDTEAIINTFGVGSGLNFTISRGLLKTDDDGNILYAASDGGLLNKIDISGDSPVFLRQEVVGANLNDFVISSLNCEIYTACGSPYGIQVFDSDTLEFIQMLYTGAYPGGVATDIDDYFIYGLPVSTHNNVLYQFDSAQKELENCYDLLANVGYGISQEKGVDIDRTAQRAFIIYSTSKFDNAENKLQVVDLKIPLSITFPDSATEGEGTLGNQGTVIIMEPLSSDLEILLISDDTSELQVPSSVTIPAGLTSIAFDITVMDDTILDGSQPVTISAEAFGYPHAMGNIFVNDNETTTLSLSIPSTAEEGDSVLADQGIISLGNPAGSDVMISLRADNLGQVVFPLTVIIPSGETSATFDLSIIDDLKIDGPQTVTITASAGGWGQSQATIAIADNEIPEITVYLPGSFAEGDGVVSDAGIITISGTFPSDHIVTLSSNNTGEITVPSSVLIPALQTSVEFDVTVIDDSETDGNQYVTVTAVSEGFESSSAGTIITDNDGIKWINDTLSSDLASIIRDDIRDRIYLGDAGNHQLVVIDSKSLEVVLRLHINSRFDDMAISKDNSHMAIAGGTLTMVDLETFQARDLYTDLDVFSAAFDQNGKLILVTSEDEGYLYQYDPNTEMIIKSFGTGPDLTEPIDQNSLLKTDATGNLLYVAQDYSINKFEITEEGITFMSSTDPIDISSSLQDFVVSPEYDEIYLAGGNSIMAIENDKLDLIESFKTGLHLIGVATDPEGYFIYGLTQYSINDTLHQVDSTQREIILHYNLLSESYYYGRPIERGVDIDRSGQRAFIIHGTTVGDDPHFKIQVVELNMPMTMSVPDSAIEGEGTLGNQGTVIIMEPLSSDLEILLISNDTSELQVPSSVTIPAGLTSIAFDITVMDDTILDGSQPVTISAEAFGYPHAMGNIFVNDNEITTLSLSIPSAAEEGDGVLAGQGMVYIGNPVDDDVIISLSADDTGEVVFPQTVIIPSGETSATFDLSVIDDIEIDGPQTITIIASVEGWGTSQDTITIEDNEVSEIVVTVPKFFAEGDGVISDAGIITISGTFPFDLYVTLSSDDSGQMTVPASIIIPAWQTSVLFDLTIIDDMETDGNQYVTITASAEGFEDSVSTTMVMDNDSMRWMDDTFSSDLASIIRDDVRDRIYLGDAGNSQLVVIDSRSCKVILRQPINSSFKDMAISKDYTTLAVSGGSIILVDLETFATRVLSAELDVVSAAFDQSGKLFLATSEDEGYLYQYDPDTEMIIKSFGTGPDLNETISQNSRLKTDATGKILYVGQYYSIHQFDIAGDSINFLNNTDSGDFSGSLQDFVISPRYDEIYVAESTSSIKVLDSYTLNLIELFETADFQRSVATDPGGYFIYALPVNYVFNSVLYQFDSAQRDLVFHYNLLSDYNYGYPLARGLVTDRLGQRAFIIHGNSDSNEPKYIIQVLELNMPLTISVPDNAREGEGQIEEKGIVTVLYPPADNLTISLESNDTSELQVPSSVIIPDGETSAVFDIVVQDDELLDGTQTVSIYGTSSEASGYGNIDIEDNETATLSLLVPETAREGDGLLSEMGVLSVNSIVDSPVMVHLSTSDDTDVQVPSIVYIQEGMDSAEFYISIVDDVELDGTQSIDITASVKGWTAAIDSISVEDNDFYLTLDIPMFVEEGDGIIENAGSVSIIDYIDYDLVINLFSDDPTKVTVPSVLTIPAGDMAAFFDITSLDDDEIEKLQKVTLTATADNFMPGSDKISVIDNDHETISWTTYQGNSSHTGYMPFMLTSNFTELWARSFSTVALNPVTTANGMAFVSTKGRYENNQLFAVSAETGEIAWKKDFGEIYSVNPPAINKGIVYIQTVNSYNNTYLKAYNLTNGEMIFQSPHGAQSERYYAPTIYDGNVYINGGDFGGAYSFDGMTGEELWFVSLDQVDNWTPAVNEDYVFAYTADTSCKLTVIDRETGGIEFTISDPNFEFYGDGMDLAPVLGSENNVIIINSGRLISFDLINKKIGWEIDDSFSGQPSVSNGQIYAISSGALSVINEHDGTLLWSWTPPEGQLTGTMVLTYSHVFTSTNSVTYAIDLETHDYVWSYPLGGNLAFGEGIIYISADSGTLAAFQTEVIDSDYDIDGILTSIEELGCTDPHDADSDDDGLTDGDEDANHNGIIDPGETSPCDPDSDGDSMPDGFEITYFGNNSRDGLGDYDNDGVIDLAEYENGTNPIIKADTDSDEMADDWEIEYFTVLTRDGTDDYDDDGLEDLQEYEAGSNPNDADTDDDTLSDGNEVKTYGTNPTMRDTDSDGMPDGWEVQYSLNPLVDDAFDDKDDDGFRNIQEYLKETDPTDPDSHPIRVLPWLPLLLE